MAQGHALDTPSLRAVQDLLSSGGGGASSAADGGSVARTPQYWPARTGIVTQTITARSGANNPGSGKVKFDRLRVNGTPELVDPDTDETTVYSLHTSAFTVGTRVGLIADSTAVNKSRSPVRGRIIYWVSVDTAGDSEKCAGLCAFANINIGSSHEYTNQGDFEDFNIYWQAGHADAGYYEIATTDYGGVVGVKNSGIRILRTGRHLVGAHIGVRPSSPPDSITDPPKLECLDIKRLQANFGIVQDDGTTITNWIGCLGWRFHFLTICDEVTSEHGAVAMPVTLNAGDILRLRYFKSATNAPTSGNPLNVGGDETGLWVKWQHDE